MIFPQFGRREYRAYQIGDQPVLADAREAWCLTVHGWRMLDENEAFMNAVSVPEPEFRRRFARLPPLPAIAFSTYSTVH